LEKFEEVYSDNRYGLWSKKIPCHFITHQIFVRVPWYGKWLADYVVKYFILKYTTCLIPDVEGEKNLSGALSHGEIPKKCQYIGWLSRFDGYKIGEKIIIPPEFDVAVILSGPEPKRGILEEKLLWIFEEGRIKAIIICGQPELSFDETKNSVRRVSHLEDNEFVEVLLRSRNIICRSGYSTLMDLHFLGKKAVLIPTPGQTEQEYLAGYLAGKGWRSIEQNELTLLNLRVVIE
jgi:predicted glycosyltransferase